MTRSLHRINRLPFVLVTLLCVALFSGCERDTDTARPASPQAETDTGSATEATSSQHSPADPANAMPAPAAGKKLDLSLPASYSQPSIGALNGTDSSTRPQAIQPQPLLPDLVDKADKEQNVKLKSNVLLKDDIVDYRDAVDGAEVEVEVKIK